MLTPDLMSLPTLPREVPSRDPARVAEGFEAIFLSILLEPVMKAGSGFFSEGAEGRIFSGLFRQQLADQLARARPLGIADSIEARLRSEGSPVAAQAMNEIVKEGMR